MGFADSSAMVCDTGEPRPTPFTVGVQEALNELHDSGIKAVLMNQMHAPVMIHVVKVSMEIERKDITI